MKKYKRSTFGGLIIKSSNCFGAIILARSGEKALKFNKSFRSDMYVLGPMIYRECSVGTTPFGLIFILSRSPIKICRSDNYRLFIMVIYYRNSYQKWPALLIINLSFRAVEHYNLSLTNITRFLLSNKHFCSCILLHMTSIS